MAPLVTEAELAQLLKLDARIVTRLISESDMPRVNIAGELRFITHEVLSWLSERREVLLPDAHSAPSEAIDKEMSSEKRSQADTVILPAADDESPFVSKEALVSLGRHAADPNYNLMRQQVRDGVAALGDALHPTLVRLSGERLNTAANEKERTSPWRLDAQMECIDHITMTWAYGEGPPGFEDRPRIALSVMSDAIEFSVKVPKDTPSPRPDKAALKQARASGAMIAMTGNQKAWSVTYLYEVVRGAPTAARLSSQLARDAKTLVPLWSLAVRGEAKA